MPFKQRRVRPKYFSEFTFGEKLILWAVRLWTENYKRKESCENILEHGLNLA